MAEPKRVIVGITGASGTILGVRLLELLRPIDGVETHLVMSPAAVRTLGIETDYSLDQVRALADVTHSFRDIGASVASGSFRSEGMIVAPCSVRTLSSVATCMSNDLIARTADVCLKERRRLVLLFRETPLHAGHIAAMDQATRNGAIVMPAVIGLYYKPQSVMEIVDHLCGRALDLLGIDAGVVRRWQGTGQNEKNGEEPGDL
ncbi:UbiX family flavin prenyltransferase [Lutibaculum baratangense]|uniref:Flavin prenyltransferase UbiX n=1 Tax=Lutibaculum baratangense AMV1 TaxID=631454 RepID=V4TM61_9HYPH|nr:UbiX family flavin prenyltransferase [Lutibaculum baratangense]ESR26853.1 3-polyprenyl-4-hydroxybenzoate carboxy-lyase UbiX [Lutibaculum baratangense AMV1]